MYLNLLKSGPFSQFKYYCVLNYSLISNQYYNMVSTYTGGLLSWENDNHTIMQHMNLTNQSCQIKCDSQNKKTDGNCSFHSNPSFIDVRSSLYGPVPIISKLSLEEKIIRTLSVGEECVKEDELRQLFSTTQHPICYDGFEPSGRMHIAQGIMKAMNVNKLTDSGCVFVFWVADWFAMLNNKLGGDLVKIRNVGLYFIEIWKALGMRMTNVRFLWASDEINKNSSAYWTTVMDIARKNNITRIKRCCQIMGRAEGDDQPASNIFYPCMQCADVFYLRADICQLGMDQRKVNMLAREYADQIKLKKKPIILSHRMLPGLQEGQEKMSKSSPNSAIFMEDSLQDINRKIKQAFCPPGITENNPCIIYVELLVFPWFNQFHVDRKEQNGGPITYTCLNQLKNEYSIGLLHPGDLKSNLAKALNEMLQPVRDHFTNNPEAKALLAKIQKY